MNSPVVDVQENIAVLHSIIDGIPDHLIDLVCFRKEQECGTICCGVGWAAMHPYFQEQGLLFQHGCNTPDIYETSRAFGQLDVLFGENSHYKLFDPRASGKWDAELLKPGMTDQQLLLARLKKGYKEYAPTHND